MRRLICAFVVRIWHKTRFLMTRLNYVWGINLKTNLSPNSRSPFQTILFQINKTIRLFFTKKKKKRNCTQDKNSLRFYLSSWYMRRATIFEPRHEKTCLMPYANNRGAEQPAHPRSLISTFVDRCLNTSIIPTLAKSKIPRRRPVWVVPGHKLLKTGFLVKCLIWLWYPLEIFSLFHVYEV